MSFQIYNSAITATEKTNVVTVLLTNEQTVRLDEISIAIRGASAKPISRAALVRPRPPPLSRTTRAF